MAKNKRTPWTKEQVEEFVAWHDARLKELNYPPELVKELTDARERWLPVPTVGV
jgi:hypothetical protein